VLNTTTGVVSVPAGTPAGNYTIEYQICENLNPTNCDPATITVSVVPPAIVANDDNYGPINGTTGNPNVGNAFDNDALNGNPIVLADITATVLTPATPVNPGDPTPALDPATGIVSVPAGTPEGVYTIEYQICENLNPTNCDPATITVNVVPPVIVANDDNYGPVDGLVGNPNVGIAFDNDALNGNPVVIADITATVLTPATPVNPGDPTPVLDPTTGIVSVPTGTPAGVYTIEYQICENLNPTNCDPATIEVTVIECPVASPATLTSCESATGAGTFTFSLAEANAQIFNGPTPVVTTYHTTQTDADNGTNAITSITAADGTVVYARIDPGYGCYSTSEVTLNVLGRPQFTLSVPDVCPGDSPTVQIIPGLNADADPQVSVNGGTPFAFSSLSGGLLTTANGLLTGAGNTVQLTNSTTCTHTQSQAVPAIVAPVCIPVKVTKIN
jgi:hypothetical protein